MQSLPLRQSPLLELRTLAKVPALLGAIAGYVDSCTFLGLFGLFVAQVTGSFVITGTELVIHDPGFLLKVLGIPFFLLGGVLTTLAVTVAIARGQSALLWAFGLEGFFIACFLIMGVIGAPFHAPNGASELATAFFGLSAMGVQSATVRLLMQGVPSTNVMTTNTTLIAIEGTRMMLAWGHLQRMPDDTASATQFIGRLREFSTLVFIALGFLSGTILGAFAFQAVGFWCLLLPALAMLSLSVWAALSAPNKRTMSAA